MIDFNNPPTVAQGGVTTAAPAPTGGDPFAPQAFPGPAPAAQAPYVQQMPPQQGAAVAPPAYVDVDEMEGGFSDLPPGTYQLKLATIEGGLSKSNKQMVTCTFEVVAGQLTGREIRKWYVTSPTWNAQKNKWNARGVAEAREDMRVMGVTAPKQFPTNAQQAAQVIGSAFVPNGQQAVFTGIVTQRTFTRKPTPENPTPKPETSTELKIATRGGSVTPVGGSSPFGL